MSGFEIESRDEKNRLLSSYEKVSLQNTGDERKREKDRQRGNELGEFILFGVCLNSGKCAYLFSVLRVR